MSPLISIATAYGAAYGASACNALSRFVHNAHAQYKLVVGPTPLSDHLARSCKASKGPYIPSVALEI